MTTLLVAGVGNIFAADDGFGVEVAQRLARRPLPSGVRVVDFGTRAIDLAYALQDDCDALVLVDTVARGGAPGTLYVIDPEAASATGGTATDVGTANAAGTVAGIAAAGAQLALGHALTPDTVLRLLAAGRGRCRRALIVGCEPQTLGDESEACVGLSAAVADAAERAVAVVERVVDQLLEKLDAYPGQDDRNNGGVGGADRVRGQCT